MGSRPRTRLKAAPPSPDPVFITVTEAAHRGSVSDDTVRRWIKLGKFPKIDIGDGRPTWRIPLAEYDAFLYSLRS